MFDHKKFSQDFKIFKLNYLEDGTTDNQLIGAHIRGLAQIDLTKLATDKEKIAFWINIYNGLTNYWVIEKQIKKSMLERPLLVMFAKITIGGYRFSLDDIEHGILRGNRRSLYKLWRQFSDKDPRNAFKINNVDYRIHFALNCGAKSCPAISFYDAQYLDKQLQLAEENFTEQEFLVDEKNKTISCSKIFWLYSKDFEKIFHNAPQYKGYKIKYLPYDFSVA